MCIVKTVLSVCCVLFCVVANAQSYTIGTGSQSGTYYPLGGMLAKVWHDNIKDFNMRAEVTAASAENVIKVANNQQLVGIAMGDVVQQAYTGRPPFPKKLDVEVLFPLYPNVVQFIVPADSDIHTISDLKGKRISLGSPGSGTRISATAILEVLGIGKNDIQAQSLNYDETADAIANNQIDAGVIVGSANVGTISALALIRDIRILSFSKEEEAKIIQALPAYQGFDVPAETYRHVPAFHALAVWNVLVVNKNLDENLAYEMTKTAFANMPAMQKVLAITSYTSLENIHKLSVVPLHKGTQKYLAELGLS